MYRTFNKNFDDVIIVDIGGSNIRVGYLSDTEQPSICVATPNKQALFLDSLIQTVQNIWRNVNKKNATIVVGCPGLIDKNGVVQKALYIDIEGVNLRSLLKKKFHCPVAIINDANLQSLAFSYHYKNFLYIVVGTGVGGSLVSNGELYTGAHGFAGEIGHIPLPDINFVCQCGQKGCLDSVASGYSLVKLLGENWWSGNPTTKKLNAISLAGSSTGKAAVLASTLFDPETLIVAGHLVSFTEFTDTLIQEFNNSFPKKEVVFEMNTWLLVVKGVQKLIQK